MSKTKAHQKYFSPLTGERVRGATTIINDHLGWNKGALIGWARKTALAGDDPNKVRDQAAEIGTLAHSLIEEHLIGTEVDRGDYAPNDLEKAENAFIAYLDWEKEQELEVIEVEVQMAHPHLPYGGTIDMLATLKGELTLVDFKTSNSIYNEHVIQCAAYRKLAVDNERATEEMPVRILHISKEGTFAEYRFTAKDLYPCWQVFFNLLQLEELKGSMPIKR